MPKLITKKRILIAIVVLGTILTIVFSVLTPEPFEPPVHPDATKEKELAEKRRVTAKPIPYEELMENTKELRGTYVKYEGIVAHIEDDGEKTTVLFVAYEPESDAVNPRHFIFLEYSNVTEFKNDDQLTIYGYVDRKEKFESLSGGESAYPIIQADFMELSTKEPMIIAGQ